MAGVSRKKLLWSTRKTGGSRHQLKLRLECDQEASGFAAGHDAMVEGERQRQHTPHCGLAPIRDHLLLNPPRSYDCCLRWHDNQIGESASDHPKIRQRNGRAAQLFRGYRARDRVSPQAVEAGPQVRYAARCDIRLCVAALHSSEPLISPCTTGVSLQVVLFNFQNIF
jgi:hypothetical protein